VWQYFTSDGQISNQISVPNHKSNLKLHRESTSHFIVNLKSKHNLNQFLSSEILKVSIEKTLQPDFVEKKTI